MIVGVHSDESYVKLKHKHTIDNTEKRMSNVKKYADQVSLDNGASTIIARIYQLTTLNLRQNCVSPTCHILGTVIAFLNLAMNVPHSHMIV